MLLDPGETLRVGVLAQLRVIVITVSIEWDHCAQTSLSKLILKFIYEWFLAVHHCIPAQTDTSIEAMRIVLKVGINPTLDGQVEGSQQF